MKFMHCADLHLCGPNAAERWSTLNRMLDICAREEVRVLLIAGDLFDTPRADARTVQTVFDAFANMPALCVMIAAGNHDPNCHGGNYDRTLPENVYVFGSAWSCVEVADYGVRIWGASFSSEKEKPFVVKKRSVQRKKEMCELGVLHGDLVSAGADSDYRAISPVSIENTGLDYLALGHIHVRSEAMRAGRTVYAYSGCTQGAGFEDVGEKGAYLGEITENGLQLNFVRLCSSVTVEEKLDITGCKSAVEIAARYAQRIGQRKDQRIKLRLIGACEIKPDVNALQRLLADAALGISIEDATSAVHDFQALAQESTLRGAFVRRMMEKIGQKERAGQNARVEHLALEYGLQAFDGEVEPNVD